MLKKELSTGRLLAVFVLILTAMPSVICAADLNVLIVGSTGNSTSTGNVTSSSTAFDPASVRTYLQNILQGAGVGTVNVAVEDRGSPYDLAAWFHYPLPADVETTTRWPKLRGQAGTVWNYVIVIGDPGTMETMPGLYAQGVAVIAQEVAKGGAETVLLMPWSKSGSASVAHYKEVVYRAGRSGPYKVAPAALAWQAAGSPNTGTAHPNADGAFIAAASVYSTIWNQSASASTYAYNDALADTVHTSVTTNNGAVQYAGNFSFQNPFLMLGDKRRDVHYSEKGTSTEQDFKGSVNAAMDRARVTYSVTPYDDNYNSNTPDDDGLGWPTANPMPIAWNHGRKFSESAKQYETNPAFWQLGMGFKYQYNTWADTVANANDTHISQILSQDVDLADYMQSGNDIGTGQHSSARTLPWRLIWAQIHQEYPTLNPLRDGSGPHMNNDLHKAVGTYMYTIYSGRCPLDVQPNPITTTWYAQKIGYETAWRLGRCQTRAPGFKVLPSAATKKTIMGGTTETMTVQFILPPKSNVTVNISSSNTSAATVSPSSLTFTPANFSTAQPITVTALSGLPSDLNFDVVYSTVSTDEVYNGLSDSWRYTAQSNLPTVAWTAASQISVGESGTMTVTAQLSAASGSAVSVPFSVTGTATNGTDFAINGSPILIATGATTGTATITITPDTIHEVNGEIVILTIGTPTNARQGATRVHTATIRDDDNTAPVVNAGPDQTVTLGSGVPWTPAFLSATAWFDASNAASISHTSGAVSQWNDLSGSNNHLVQATSTARPTTGTVSINGRNAIDFDGTSDVMAMASNPFSPTINDAMIIMVHRVESTTAQGVLFSLSGSETAANRWQSHCPWSDGTLYFDTGNSTGANRVSAAYGATVNDVAMVSFYGSTTNNVQQVHKNGTLLIGDATGHAVATAGNPAIGAMSTFQNTSIAEVIMIRGTVSAATREQLEGYLAHKWGLTANLPAGHPYKSAAPTTASAVANLDGTVSDANGDPLTTTWTLVSGPAGVGFASPSSVDTTATFTVAGTYTLRLAANDTYGPISDDVVITVNSSSPNNAPTISNIADTATNEDTATGAIAFTVGDVETAAGSLTVSGSSSNTTLVPNANIVFGGSGTSRTVTVTPALNQSGTATITVPVSDGSLTATDTFVLTVTAVNDPPTISNIADQTTTTGVAVSNIPFTVGDVETAATSLSLSGTSNNTTLVPNANITFGGSGASRTVTVTPAAGQSGSATITVTVSDGTLTATDTFVLTVNSTLNTAPTISNIADTATNEDTATPAISFTVGDAETAASSLTVTRTSSNTTLVPIANIIMGGSGASRTVTITPAANQNGTATITVTVSDGALTASDSFVLTVNVVNDAPTISNIANAATNEDTPTSAIAFTVGDIDTTTLTVSGSSSNTALIPNANIVFGGSGTNRTVTITPAANQSGTSTISVTVSDGALTATDTFVLTVNASNDAPTISNIANAATNEDTTMSAIAFTVGDVETAAGSLTVSGSSSNTALIPNANIVFGGSGASRTISITPAANQNGSATITVTVSDGALTATDTFVLTVNAVNDAPVATASSINTVRNSAVSGMLPASDIDGNPLTFSIVTNGALGTAVIPNATTGAFTYTPFNNQRGTDTFTFRVSDGTLNSNVATVTISITNGKPTASGSSLSTTSNTTVSGAMLAADPDGDALTWSIVTNGVKGTAAITNATTGAFTYTPNAGVSGTDTITFQVTDGFDVSNLAIVNITINNSLTISSAPLATPNPANTGSSVQFGVVAVGKDPLTYLWDLGDGSNAAGATVFHSYAVPGIYNVTVTVADASGQTAAGSLQMTVIAGANPDGDTDGDGVPNGLDTDDDNDGVSDENEVADGTDPNNPASMQKTAFDLSKMGGSIKFNATGKDACFVSGTLPALKAGFNPLGIAVKIDIGGATRNFTLDAKGRAKSADGSFALKLKLTTNKTTKKKEFLGGAAPFKAKLTKGSWMEAWRDEGIDPVKSMVKTPIPILVDITFAGRIYTHTTTVIYTSKATVSGKFKK